MSGFSMQSSIDRYITRSTRSTAGMMDHPNRSTPGQPPTIGASSFLRSLPGREEPSTSSNKIVFPIKRSASHFGESSGRRKIAAPNKLATIAADPTEDQIRVITGTVANCLLWRKLFPNLFALWEVFATVLRVQRGSASGEKLLLLRKNDGGPVMQGFFFEIDFELPDDIVPGTSVRCVGRFVGTGCRFHLFKVRRAQDDCVELVSRLSVLSNFALAKGKQPSKLASVL